MRALEDDAPFEPVETCGMTKVMGGLFSRYVTRTNALNVLLLGEATFHQVHRVPLRPSAFRKALAQEHLHAFRLPYRQPDFGFLSDLGVAYDRVKAVEAVLFGHDPRSSVVVQK